jgi:DNA-binding NtrC family response regulator
VADDVSVRDLCRDLLSSHGYLPLVAANARDAMRLLSENDQKIEIVILDYAMPRIDGFRLAAHIKRLYPGLPVILFTGSSLLSEEVPLCIDALLEKPCSSQLIIEQIRTLMERRTTIGREKTGQPDGYDEK